MSARCLALSPDRKSPPMGSLLVLLGGQVGLVRHDHCRRSAIRPHCAGPAAWHVSDRV